MSQGVIVGCDIKQQWMLPWWWRHYSLHNNYPVIFIDFGMSEEALSWCRERGECLSLFSCPFSLSSGETVPAEMKECWEERYGVRFWMRREAWFKKPFSLLQSPFSIGIWMDIDCQVNANLEMLFQLVNFGAEIAIAKDSIQQNTCLDPREIHYNSGVIVFQKNAPILRQWVDTSLQTEHLLPGDQETLSRAISLFQPKLIELPLIYNWYRIFPPNDQAIINHFCGARGKLELMRIFSPQSSTESLMLLQSLQSSDLS